MPCRPGKLLKFDIGDRGIQLQDGQPVGADLRYTGLANQRRGRADSCSKVRCWSGVQSGSCVMSSGQEIQKYNENVSHVLQKLANALYRPMLHLTSC